MAERLGCGLTRMDRFYGHVLSRDALDNARLWPYPQLDPLAANGIVVGPDGRRFVDEGRGGVFIANAIAKLSDPSGAWAILDEAIWESAGRQSLYPPNPHLVDAGGTLLRAAALGELAKACGLDVSVVENTVSEFNRAAENGPAALAGLDMPRTQAATVIRAPFVAVPLVAGITNTMGGLAVDARARVLDPDGKPIGNLYAVGASAGGLEGGRYVGYVGGLVRALTSGLAAADDLAAHWGKAARPVLSSASGSRQVQPAPPGRPEPTVLRMLARYPLGISVVAALITFAIVLVLTWPVVALVAFLPALAIGAVVFLLAKAFCELAAIILDVLLPG
jgi:fumarate reductase flavoprotein subunit